jgi:hypothetical protein
MEWDMDFLTNLVLEKVVKDFYVEEDRIRRNLQGGLSGIRHRGRYFYFGFSEEDGRQFRVDFISDNQEAETKLIEYLASQVETEAIFEGVLKKQGKKLDFPQYAKRLPYQGYKLRSDSGMHEISALYRVNQDLLDLNVEMFTETVCDYALLPTVTWLHNLPPTN